MTTSAAVRFGVVTFPGANCEQDAVHALRLLGYEASYVWHQDTSLAGLDAIVLPGGFSYGDYLRCGAVARFSPIMQAIVREAEAGMPVIGICNGFQVLTEAHLLPGALMQNRKLKFICKRTPVAVQESVCQWLDLEPGTVVELPIAHNEGNYVCDQETLEELKRNKQIVLRYCNEDGSFNPEGTQGTAPNGSVFDIAGICNKAGNVFGLMPHPERVVDPATGFTQGSAFFTAIAKHVAQMA